MKHLINLLILDKNYNVYIVDIVNKLIRKLFKEGFVVSL